MKDIKNKSMLINVKISINEKIVNLFENNREWLFFYKLVDVTL